MKKTVLIFIAAIILVTLCAGTIYAQEEYADFKATFEKVLNLLYIFIDDMDRAQSPSEIAQAITDMNSGMAALTPEMDAMDEKYPHITDTDYPEALEDIMAEYHAMYVEVEAASLKMFEYIDDPEVQAALEMME